MLDVNRMKATFKQKMKDAFEDQGFDENDPNFNKYATAICETIIEEFVQHATVTVQYKDGQWNNTTSLNVDVDREANGGIT